MVERGATEPAPENPARMRAAKGERSTGGTEAREVERFLFGRRDTWTGVGLRNQPGCDSRQPNSPLLLARPAPCRT